MSQALDHVFGENERTEQHSDMDEPDSETMWSIIQRTRTHLMRPMRSSRVVKLLFLKDSSPKLLQDQDLLELIPADLNQNDPWNHKVCCDESQ